MNTVETEKIENETISRSLQSQTLWAWRRRFTTKLWTLKVLHFESNSSFIRSTVKKVHFFIKTYRLFLKSLRDCKTHELKILEEVRFFEIDLILALKGGKNIKKVVKLWCRYRLFNERSNKALENWKH